MKNVQTAISKGSLSQTPFVRIVQIHFVLHHFKNWILNRLFHRTIDNWYKEEKNTIGFLNFWYFETEREYVDKWEMI